MGAAGYRLLEHTADMGIEATAGTAGELFVQATRGLLEILGGRPQEDGLEVRTIEVEGVDRADLLVRWLGEILYLVESGGFHPASFEVEEAGEQRFRAQVRGTPLEAAEHPLDREVKAITYHGLTVEETGEGWRARVYVDL